MSPAEFLELKGEDITLLKESGPYKFYRKRCVCSKGYYFGYFVVEDAMGMVYYGFDLPEALASWREIAAIHSDGGVETLLDKFQQQLDEQAALFAKIQEVREQDDDAPDLFMPEAPKFTLN